MTEVELNGDFRETSLANIESTLDQLWREVSENALMAGGPAVSRNMVLSLLTFTEDAAQARAALAAIEGVMVQHPSRAIVVLPNPRAADSGIAARVAVHHEGAGATAASGEKIAIEAWGDAARHVPGVVLPLLLTGLPAFLWWNGELPWGSALIETLVDGSDRLVIDSCEAQDPERMIGAVADLIRRKHNRCAVSDFNWTRLMPWRELTAQFFDSATLRPYLQGVDRVTVEYAAGEEEEAGNYAQAYVFLGWMASRLGWTLPTGHRRGFGPARQHTLHDAAGRSIVLEVNARFGMRTDTWAEIDRRAHLAASARMEPGERGEEMGAGRGEQGTAQPMVGRGALMSVRIHAQADRRPGTFIIARDQDLQHATTLCQVDAGAPPPHTVHLASLGETALLHSQLELVGHDAIYEDALLTAARLLGVDTRRGGL
jgi:glucose-6-phosphate dehydrogenase assembly protein OpcA